MLQTENKSHLKDHLEQEGITHDDVINQEIEQEHKEAAQKNEIEKINEKFKNKNLYPIKVKLSIKMLDFIDISELNEKTIKYKDYVQEQQVFTKEHTKLTQDLIEEIKQKLQSNDLHVLSISNIGDPLCPKMPLMVAEIKRVNEN